ncbi:MAG: folate/biopterin family MFS transporter, partial [Candidatus Omnitrophica bacterium]|nr:folate/biopterin family MFS transporter [Candidatus Omnitrophota bacterium]
MKYQSPYKVQLNKKKLFWVFALSSSVYFTQGIEALPSQGLFYYLKETLHFSPQKIMVISSIPVLAWLVKPLIGYVIDNFFTKKKWIFISLGLDILLVLALGLIQLPLAALIALLALNSADSAFRDVAVDGVMCVEGKKYNATGKIQSIQWIALSCAGIITGVGGGYLAQIWGYRGAFLCLIPIYILVALPAYFYRETIVRSENERRHLFSDLKALFCDKYLLLVALFIFLYKYSPSFGTPLFFIQRDVFKWGKVWIGVLSTLGTVFGIVGSIFYYKFSQKINIKKWLFVSVFLGAVTTMSYLYYTPITAVVYDIIYSFIG